MSEKMNSLVEDVCHAVVAQVKRYDDRLGCEDNSAYESYGRIKDVLEQMQEAVKPLEKTLKSYWDEVVRDDPATQAAMLRTMLGTAETAIRQAVCVAAMVSRALASLDSEAAKKVGQLSLDDLEEEYPEDDETRYPSDFDPDVDEETGEIIWPDEDLPEAGEVLGADE